MIECRSKKPKFKLFSKICRLSATNEIYVLLFYPDIMLLPIYYSNFMISSLNLMVDGSMPEQESHTQNRHHYDN